MRETHEQVRCVLIVRLPREVETRIEDTYLTLRHSTRPAMGYHITLLGPFYLRDAPRFAARVAAVCRRRKPFSVRLRRLGTFTAPDNNVVFLQLAAPRRVRALHDALLRATDDLIVAQNERVHHWNVVTYRPHVTLGLGLTDEGLAYFLRLAAERPFDESFAVTRVWLATQAPNGPWEYRAEYALGSGPSV